MYLQPLKHKVFSLIGLEHHELQDASVRSWVIAPAEQGKAPPAIYDVEDLERVIASPSATTPLLEISRLQAENCQHYSTRAFLLKDVDVVDGYLYGARWKTRVLPAKAPLLQAKPEMRVAQGTMACTWNGNQYFGHWLTDDLSLHLAGESIGSPFILERKPFMHEPGYRHLLGIPARAYGRAHFDELTIIEDIGQNNYKRQRYEELRRRIAAGVPATGAKRVFIARGVTGEKRVLVNEPALEAYLEAQGFLVLHPEKLTPAQIVRQTMGAELVIGVEGSHLFHVFLTMAPGAVICCIQPPFRFVTSIRDYASCLDMHYAITVGHMAPGGFSVPIDGLKRLLDKIDASLTRH